MRTPASGTPAAASAERTTRAPAADEPRRATVAPSSLSTISAAKLSLSPFTSARSSTAAPRGRRRSGAHRRGAGRSPTGRSRRSRVARARPHVGAGGGDRRAVHAGEPRARDRERRERPRLDPEVARLPAEPVAPRVEVRVVAEHTPRDPPDPGGRELAREPVEVAAVERRVAVADEPEVPVPDATRSRARRRRPRYGSGSGGRAPQRRERDRELLGRGRKERAVGVRRVDGRARPEIDRDRRRVPGSMPGRGGPGRASPRGRAVRP